MAGYGWSAGALLLPLMFLSGAHAAQNAAVKSPQNDEIKFVEFFVNAPVSQLPPQQVERFMAVDPARLPAKLRPRYKARKLELHALKHIAEGNKKGTVRIPDANCDIPGEAKDDDPQTLGMAGFVEIAEDEKDYLQEKTQCSERELMCEFSMQIVVERDKKTGKVKRRRYYLHSNDPLFALVGAYRSDKRVGGNTQFFGRAGALCSH